MFKSGIKAIHIEAVEIKDHRYPTLGDYWIDDQGVMQMRIAHGFTPRANMCMVLHELAEAFMCLNDGVTFYEIDHFDKVFEERIDVYQNAEPGDDPQCPYGRQHRRAENLERLLADYLGMHWDAYVVQFDQLCAEIDRLKAAGHWPTASGHPESAPCPSLPTPPGTHPAGRPEPPV